MKRKKVAVIGTGYVGLVSGTCLAEIGHSVLCVDQDKQKIAALSAGEIPIYEPGLKELVLKNSAEGLRFTTDLPQAVKWADIIMIAVGTPMSDDGSADLRFIWNVVDEAAPHIDRPKVVIIKSTVPVGTNDMVEERLLAAISHCRPEGNSNGLVAVISNPEFLREGRAVYDFMQGDRVVVGGADPDAQDEVAELYEPLGIPIVRCDRRSSEMIKYASNAFLATKISFINSVARLCDKLGADVTKVAEGMGYDHRIKSEHLRAGLGYGGSCFPKDVAAMLHFANEAGVDFEILRATSEVNRTQVDWVVERLEQRLGNLSGKTICLWGVAFKPDTDDVREAPFHRLVELLLARKAKIQAYDPVARPQFFVDRVTLSSTPYECARGAHAAVLVTEWAEFASLDFTRVREMMINPFIVDGRNYLNPEFLESVGFLFDDLGRVSGHRYQVELFAEEAAGTRSQE